MAWTIEFDDKALRDLARLDKTVQKRIRRYLEDRIAPATNPRLFGHGLAHDLSNLWRYRVGDFRILCRIEDETVVVYVVEIGHRSTIYER